MVGMWWISIVLIFSRINKLAYYLEYLLLLFLILRRVRLSRGGDRGELQKSNSTDVGELGNEVGFGVGEEVERAFCSSCVDGGCWILRM